MSFAAGIIVKATIILICAGLMSLAWRRASSSARYAIWAVAMLGILILPLASITLPQWELPVLPDETQTAQVISNFEPGPVLPQSEAPVSTSGFRSSGPVEIEILRPEPLRTLPWQEWLTLVWALGAMLVLTRLTLGTLAVRRLMRDSKPLVDADWSDLLVQVAAQLGIRKGVRLMVSEAPVPPMTWGLFRHTILLPNTGADWSTERRRVVVAHEMAHVKRNDGVMQFLSQIVCAVYWFNPMAWYAERRLRIEREKACDDHVLNLGASADDYADHLLHVARGIRRSRRLSSATVSMAHPSQLETRLRAILDAGIRRYALSRVAATFLILVIAVFTFFVSTVQLTAMATMLIPPALVLPPPPVSPIAAKQNLTAEQSRPASVEGMVVKLGTGEPLGGTTVELYRIIDGYEDRSADPYETATGADGKFIFQNVSPGQYRLVALRTDAFTGAEYGQRSVNTPGTPLVLTAGQKAADIHLALAPTGSISGRILDRDGEPLGRVRVHAMRLAYPNGTRSLMIVQAVHTNDLGEYRLFWLPPGRYYISAMPEDPRSPVTPLVNAPNTVNLYAFSTSPLVTHRALDDGRVQEEVYVPTYFPNTPRMEEAAPIDLGAGENLGNVGLTLAPPVPTRRIRGRVINGKTGQPAANASVRMTPLAFSPNPTMLRDSTDSNGSFDMSSVMPGDYYVSASVGSEFQGDSLTAALNLVSVGDTDLENLTLTALPGFDVPVNVTIEGQALGENGLTITLQRGGNNPLLRESAQPSPLLSRPNLLIDGMFRPIVLKGIRPGTHQVVPGAMGTPNVPKNAYIKSIRFGGVDVLSDGLHLERPPEGALEILVGTDVAVVEGVVVDEKRDPLANVSVVLIPDPPNRHRIDLYTVVSSDAAGRFRMEDLAPGSYRIFAWEEIASSAWQDSEFIRPYEGRGKPVHVGGNSTQDIQVSAIPPELQ